MILFLRPDMSVPVHHIGGEMDELVGTSRIHSLDDVLRSVEIDGKEEIVPLRADLNWGKHLGGQIVDHVVCADAKSANCVRIGYIGHNEGSVGIVRQIAFTISATMTS